jgi:hypothetical protein
LISICRRDAHITRRVVASLSGYDDLLSKLRSRHQSSSFNRYVDEAYLAAFEANLKDAGKPSLANEKLYTFRHEGFGLDCESALYEIWAQCIARFHSTPIEKVPASVKLIVGGVPDTEIATLVESVAVLLADETPFLRRKNLPVEKYPNLGHEVVRQWVKANGITRQQDLDAVEKLIGQDADHRLSAEPVNSFAKLDASMVSKARELAAKVNLGTDNRFVFYVFRCLQRIAAYAVDGRVQWRSEWLRGTKTNARAIPGTSKMQAELGALLKEHVLDTEKGHSGSKGTATIYRLKIGITLGEVDHHQAAKELGLVLDAKGIPKK